MHSIWTLLFFCAGRENRTPVFCLEGRHSTTKPYPQYIISILIYLKISTKTFNNKIDISLYKHI